MSIIISFHPGYSDWYVSELYSRFAKKMDTWGITYIPMQTYASEFSESYNYRENGYPSLFNEFNLIVHNTSTNKSFIHSLQDYAPIMIHHTSAIDKLGLIAFSFSSNFTTSTVHEFVELIPSFYITEHLSDLSYIEENNVSNKKRQCYFNGLLYGRRQEYKRLLINNEFFVIKDKTTPDDFKNKPDYYVELSQYKYGMSLDGAAKICYRDLEYFGMGILNLREELDVLTHERLLPNVHYKCIFDNFVKENINRPEMYRDLNEYIIDNINKISVEEERYIIQNARKWFLNNALPKNQISFLYECVEKYVL